MRRNPRSRCDECNRRVTHRSTHDPTARFVANSLTQLGRNSLLYGLSTTCAERTFNWQSLTMRLRSGNEISPRNRKKKRRENESKKRAILRQRLLIRSNRQRSIARLSSREGAQIFRLSRPVASRRAVLDSSPVPFALSTLAPLPTYRSYVLGALIRAPSFAPASASAQRSNVCCRV